MKNTHIIGNGKDKVKIELSETLFLGPIDSEAIEINMENITFIGMHKKIEVKNSDITLNNVDFKLNNDKETDGSYKPSSTIDTIDSNFTINNSPIQETF